MQGNDVNLYGAAVLSKGLTHIALVKPSGCPLWCFPVGDVGGDKGKAAAATVVRKQTGVDVSKHLNEEDSYDAVFPEKDKKITRMYIAHTLQKGNLVPDVDSSIDTAEWKEIGELLNLSEDTPVDEQPSLPLILPLKQWIAKRHDLRFEGDYKMGSFAIFSSSRWKGPLPLEILQKNLKKLVLPAATVTAYECNLFNSGSAGIHLSSGVDYWATCVLPNLGIQITPEVCYSVKRDAMENAALAGILYLNDCIDCYSKSFNISYVGDIPQIGIPFKEKIIQNGPKPKESNLAPRYVPPAHKHSISRENMVISITDLKPTLPIIMSKYTGLTNFEKNAITLLKEFADKYRTSQPEYKQTMVMDSLRKELYMYTVCIRSITPEVVGGGYDSDDKVAKKNAAKNYLDVLISQGMVVIQ